MDDLNKCLLTESINLKFLYHHHQDPESNNPVKKSLAVTEPVDNFDIFYVSTAVKLCVRDTTRTKICQI